MAKNYINKENFCDSVSFSDVDISYLRNLLLNGYDCNAIMLDTGFSLLHLAVGDERYDFAMEATKLCLKYGGDPNLRSIDGFTPMHVCSAWGRADVLKLLLNCGGNPDTKDDLGLNSREYALKEGHLNILEIISSFEEYKAKYSSVRYEQINNTINKINLVNDWCDKYVKNFTKEDHTSNSLQDSELERSVKPLQTTFFDEDSDSNDNDVISSSLNLHSIKSKESSTDDTNEFKTCSSFISNTCNPEKEENIISGIVPIITWCDTNSPKMDNETQFPQDSLFTYDVSVLTSDDSSPLPRETEDKSLSTINIPETPESSLSPISISEPYPSHYDILDCNITRRQHYSLHEQMLDFTQMQDDFKKFNNSTSSHGLVTELENNISEDSLFSSQSRIEINKGKLLQNLKKTMNDDEDEISNMAEIKEKLDDNCQEVDDNESVKTKTSILSIPDSYVAIAEQKNILVDDLGVELVELRYLTAQCVPQSDVDETKSNISSDYSLPRPIDYDSDGLRRELTSLGLNPGPITSTTKNIYIKKLFKLKRHPERLQTTDATKSYSHELNKALKSSDLINDMKKFMVLDNSVTTQFSMIKPQKKWRGGSQKTSFTYLLLDPRITNNLPTRVNISSVPDTWPIFIESIFYVGKGIRSRPYAHLYEAVEIWNKNDDCNKKQHNNKKIQRIIDIWKSGSGVICLNVFQHVIPVEAFTREASMIDALSLTNLTNIKSGEYYGVAGSWPYRDKRNLGVYLLYRAMNIFLNEGERQIRPADIK